MTPYNASTPIPIAPAPAASVISNLTPPAAVWPPSATPQNPTIYQPDALRSEFSVLSDFLDTLDERAFYGANGAPVNPQLAGFPRRASNSAPAGTPDAPSGSITSGASSGGHTGITPKVEEYDGLGDVIMTAAAVEDETVPVEDLLPAATKAERFLLTAADQSAGSRVERLNRVIHSKYEAGLLKPYNYVHGYARLSRWMDRK